MENICAYKLHQSTFLHRKEYRNTFNKDKSFPTTQHKMY